MRGLTLHIFIRSWFITLLKKPSLGTTILDNFWLVSNLPLWGKMIEKVVAQQLQSILEEANYLDPFQLWFGSEMQIVSVMLWDDLWWRWDGDYASSLPYLTSLRLLILSTMVSFSNQKTGGRLHQLYWFASFLQSWFQSVVVVEEKSHASSLLCRVLQGAVFSRFLFNFYMALFCEFICCCGIRYQQYAVDTSYISLSLAN